LGRLAWRARWPPDSRCVKEKWMESGWDEK
jgi:hypothetical protein